MKHSILLTLCLFFSCFAAKAQTIANDNMNIVYRGIGNPISISIPEYSCESLIVEVDCGTLNTLEDMPCRFIYETDTSNSVNFNVYVQKNEGRQQVAGATFRVKNLPAPEPYIGKYGISHIPFNVLNAQLGIIASIRGFQIDAGFTVTSFKYIILRDKKVFTTGENLSNKFDAKIKRCFSSLENNDEIIFYNIFCTGPDKTTRKLQSFELTITK